MAFTPSPTWNRDPNYLYPGHPRIPRFGYPGSKCNLAKRIVQMLPPEGQRFVDVFAGRGNVTFAVSQLLNYKTFWMNDHKSFPFFDALRGTDPTPNISDADYQRLTQAAKGQDNSLSYPRMRSAKKRGQWMEWVETCTALSGNPHLRATNVHLVEALLCYSGGYYGSSGPKSRGPIPSHQMAFQRRCSRAGDIMLALKMRVTGWDYRRVLDQLGSTDMVYL
jgi:site-specific DNA-adenine methylase